MHLAYRFDVKPFLRGGANELSIASPFAPPWNYAREQVERLGYLPNSSYPHPFNFIRKMACNFGWDWGPSLVTAGVWQPIYSGGVGGRPHRFGASAGGTEASKEEAVVEVQVEVEGVRWRGSSWRLPWKILGATW